MSAKQAVPAAAADEKKKLTFILESSDGVQIAVEEDAARQSNLLKKMMDDLGILDADSPMMKEPLTITAVDGWTLQKTIDWCNARRGQVYYKKDDSMDARIELTAEDNAYLNVTSQQLLSMLIAANYLDIEGISDIITQKMANDANGKTVEELREMFGLEKDLTDEEEEEIRKRFEWLDV